MENISFFFEYEGYKIDKEDLVKDWVLFVISHYKAAVGSLNYIFLSDEQLLEMNQQYLSHDYYTDILTFPSGENGGKVAGDIYISLDRVKENAKTYEVSMENELHRVMIHGVLHLLGFDDHGEEKEKMREKEDHALSLRKF